MKFKVVFNSSSCLLFVQEQTNKEMKINLWKVDKIVHMIRWFLSNVFIIDQIDHLINYYKNVFLVSYLYKLFYCISYFTPSQKINQALIWCNKGMCTVILSSFCHYKGSFISVLNEIWIQYCRPNYSFLHSLFHLSCPIPYVVDRRKCTVCNINSVLCWVKSFLHLVELFIHIYNICINSL